MTEAASTPTEPAPHVYDFFAGAGGASAGLRAAGMEIAFALDRDADACASFAANFPHARVENADIRTLDAGALRRRVRERHPHPVVFVGCAPCQPFTRHRTTRRHADERTPPAHRLHAPRRRLPP